MNFPFYHLVPKDPLKNTVVEGNFILKLEWVCPGCGEYQQDNVYDKNDLETECYKCDKKFTVSGATDE